VETVDAPALGFELIGEKSHDRRADLERHEHVWLVAEELSAPVEVARMTEERDDDREIIGRFFAWADRAASPPGEHVLEVERDKNDREDQRDVRHATAAAPERSSA
jgi:hypothetical protein